MTRSILMKSGAFVNEKRAVGALYRNVFQIDALGANVTHLLPGTKSEKFSHEGHEIHVVMKGELEYHVGEETFLLKEGDMLFHSSEPTHWSANPGVFECVYVTVSTPFTAKI